MNVSSKRVAKSLQRAGHVALCDGRNVLIWGGYRENSSHPDGRYLPPHEIHIYDGLIGAWNVFSTKGKIPPGISGSASGIVGDFLYILGGYRQDEREAFYSSRNTNSVYQLNLKTREWIKITTSGDKPMPCDKMSSWVYNDKIYLFGGFGLNPYYPNMDREVAKEYLKKFEFIRDENSASQFSRGWNNQLVVFDTNENCWQWPKCKGPKPSARAAHASACIGQIVYTFGGRHENFRMNDMHCLELSTMTWSGSLPMTEPMPEGRSWHSLNVLSDWQLVLFGGFSQDGRALSDCWVFNIKNHNWTPIQMPGLMPRVWHTSCMSDYREMIIVGGCCNNILDHTQTVYADESLIVSFSPKSLFRLALDLVSSYKPNSRSTWNDLPKSIQQMLHRKALAS